MTALEERIGAESTAHTDTEMPDEIQARARDNTGSWADQKYDASRAE